MSRSNDPHRELGARVTAKATAVSSHAEFKCLFKSLWKVETVEGVVKDVFKNSSGKRQQTSLVVDWEIKVKKKRCFTKLCNTRIDDIEEKHGRKMMIKLLLRLKLLPQILKNL